MIEPIEFLTLTWDDFDRAAAEIAQQFPDAEAVYGEPRGGLPLAVAVSHWLDVPLVDRPGPGVLWIDDLYETGRTAVYALEWGSVQRAVWVTTDPSPEVFYVMTALPGEWVVFPWEVGGTVMETAGVDVGEDHRAY